MVTTTTVFAVIIAYLLGSIPASVWVGQFFYGVDVREHGSGNAGATNTFRVLGKRAGVPVLIFDILKGWLAVKSAFLISDYASGSEDLINLQLALGIAALIGHIFPIYIGFRGGKGIATLLGIVFAVHLNAALISVLIFLTVLISTRYVSLSSIIAAVIFPVLIIVVFHTTVPSLIVFSIFIALLVVITHQKNIERLMAKKEAKVSLSKKKAEV